MIKLSMRQLCAIRALAETCNFTSAATRLNTTQSNISIAIREAEAALGVKLFDRTTKKVMPSETGKQFIRSVSQILDALETQVDDIRSIGSLSSGSLKIGVTPLLGSTLLSKPIARLNHLHPEIKIHLRDASTDELHALLQSRHIELAIGTFEKPAIEVTTTTLFEDALLVLSHPSLGLGKEVTWEELSQHRTVGIAPDSSVGRIVQNTFESLAHAKPRELVHSQHWLTVMSLARSMRAACIAPAYVRAAEYDFGLQQSALTNPVVSRRIEIAVLRNQSLSPAAERFLDLLHEQLKHSPSAPDDLYSE